jgi:hypothetical protein
LLAIFDLFKEKLFLATFQRKMPIFSCSKNNKTQVHFFFYLPTHTHMEIQLLKDKNPDIETILHPLVVQMVENLSPIQKIIHELLVACLPYYMHTREHSTDLIYNWNLDTWQLTTVRMAKSLWNKPRNIMHDCWLSDPTKRGVLDIRQGHFIDKSKFVPEKELVKKAAPLYRLSYILLNPGNLLDLQWGSKENSNLFQIAHLCHHQLDQKSQNPCWNPWHCMLTDDKTNKNMIGCTFGCAFLCPHSPRCIWTTADGIWMPCRNRNVKFRNCNCVVNCWDTANVGWRKPQ